ncbi:MAG: sigma-70 family RNA polymerase sigma factor, partial [Pseudomonadota bacterium]
SGGHLVRDTERRALSRLERSVRERPPVRRCARSLTGDPVDADDLVQMVLERALGRLYLLRKPASLRAWLFRMTYNLYVNDRIRRGRAPITRDPHGPGLDVATAGDQEARLHAKSVINAMQRLPEDQRVAIALTALEELSYKEAAAILEIPIGTLMSRLHRGRQTLRELTEAPPERSNLKRVK